MNQKRLITFLLLMMFSVSAMAQKFAHGEVLTDKFTVPNDVELVVLAGEIQFVNRRSGVLQIGGKRIKLSTDLPIHGEEDVVKSWDSLKVGDEIYAFGYRAKENADG